jgi:hypothetical protein
MLADALVVAGVFHETLTRLVSAARASRLLLGGLPLSRSRLPPRSLPRPVRTVTASAWLNRFARPDDDPTVWDALLPASAPRSRQ